MGVGRERVEGRMVKGRMVEGRMVMKGRVVKGKVERGVGRERWKKGGWRSSERSSIWIVFLARGMCCIYLWGGGTR
jgi:hypothetical protein